MSIKISGKDNTIRKENNNNNVYIDDALYVDRQKVDPEGEISTNYVKINGNGIVDLTGYNKNTTVFQIRVSSYDDMSNVVKVAGHKYYDITSNNIDVKLSDLDDSYTDLFVNITNPNPDDPEDPEDPVEPEVETIKNTYAIAARSKSATTSKKITINLINELNFEDYDIVIEAFDFHIIWDKNAYAEEELLNQTTNMGFLFRNFVSLPQTHTSTVEVGRYDIIFTVELFQEDGGFFLEYSYTAKLNPNYEAGPGCTLSIGNNSFDLTITQTPKNLASTLTLRQSYSANIKSIENLIVNNDALIQGNLTVSGYINDLKWYWDYINFDTPVINLGTGFLAKIIDTSIVIDENTISIPALQLSPGGIYTTDLYNISWKSDGNMIIESSNVISNITGLIQVLRYE